VPSQFNISPRFTDAPPPLTDIPFPQPRFLHNLAERNDKKAKIMKTLIQSLTIQIAIYSVLFLLLAGIAYGADLNTNPPYTAEVMVEEFAMEDEAYIDDIPFDTKAISANHKMNLALNESFSNEDEEYINDIPFNTESIAVNALYEEALHMELTFEDESYVDDIPSRILQIALNQSENLVLGK
jgi:hypothetical protein